MQQLIMVIRTNQLLCKKKISTKLTKVRVMIQVLEDKHILTALTLITHYFFFVSYLLDQAHSQKKQNNLSEAEQEYIKRIKTIIEENLANLLTEEVIASHKVTVNRRLECISSNILLVSSKLGLIADHHEESLR